MMRIIVKPTKSNLTIKLPENLVGKVIEVDETTVVKKEAARKSVQQLKCVAIKEGVGRFFVQ